MILEEIDLNISRFFFNLFNKNLLENVPQIFGLIPYEFYVIPGMYLAILQVLWFGSPDPIQFHLLPHWFAYSIFQFLKKVIKRKRPGCFHKDLNKFIDKSHCSHGHEYQSFPSGHTGVSFSLAVALFMEMQYSRHPKFFEVSIENENAKNIISNCGLFVASMIALHRVSKGYHSFFDVIVGGIIGACIGFVSWTTLEYYKKKYQEICKKNKDMEECDHYKKSEEGKDIDYWLFQYSVFKNKMTEDKFISKFIGVSRIILSFPILFLLFKFLTKDVFNLASIKH